jgi:hypothetical protein
MEVGEQRKQESKFGLGNCPYSYPLYPLGYKGCCCLGYVDISAKSAYAVVETPNFGILLAFIE